MHQMLGNYPVYELTNGVRAKFMCMNKENLEMYKNLLTGEMNLIKDENGNWSESDGSEWGVRKVPLFGVSIKKIIGNDIF